MTELEQAEKELKDEQRELGQVEKRMAILDGEIGANQAEQKDLYEQLQKANAVGSALLTEKLRLIESTKFQNEVIEKQKEHLERLYEVKAQ